MANNKKAVVTGGTKGIGRAIVEKLLAEGYDVAVCARSVMDLWAMETECEKKYPKQSVLTFQADMSNKIDIVNFAHFIEREWDTLDVLVNNAGIFLPGEIISEEDGMLEKMMETNLYSAYYLTRALLPMILRGGTNKHIFNMCSVASIKAYANGGSYSISKFALLGFSKNLREELKPNGVKVTAILPGATWSDSWSGFEAPTDRLMQANDVAEVVITALNMSPSAVLEEIILRPQLGDL